MYAKEVKRWLKALEIAKVLFEEERYHNIYLDEIETFIRRNTMYSPKISEDLVPELYKVSVSKKIPMTKLVNRIIKDYLEKHVKTNGGIKNHESENKLGKLQRA